MKKTILYKTLFFCWTILALTGCDLDLQKNYDYEPSVDDPYVKVTAWEYFQDHKDMFSELIAAIEYTGLKDYYTQTDNKYTFLALNNAGMQLYRENEFAGVASITDCDKEKVKNMLLYHIVDGEYSSYGQLQVEPMFVLTMLKGETGLMTMSVWKNPWQAAVSPIWADRNSIRRRRRSTSLPVWNAEFFFGRPLPSSVSSSSVLLRLISGDTTVELSVPVDSSAGTNCVAACSRRLNAATAS